MGRTREDTFEPGDVGRIVHVATHPRREDFYVAMESWRRPRTIARVNPPVSVASQGGPTLERWWQRRAPIDPDALVLEECSFTARDGERLSLYLVTAKAPAAEQTRSTGDADTLIDFFHIRKMAARLQQASRSERPVLLSYDEHRGHRGQLPLVERARSLADQIAFLRAQTGVGESNG